MGLDSIKLLFRLFAGLMFLTLATYGFGSGMNVVKEYFNSSIGGNNAKQFNQKHRRQNINVILALGRLSSNPL